MMRLRDMLRRRCEAKGSGTVTVPDPMAYFTVIVMVFVPAWYMLFPAAVTATL